MGNLAVKIAVYEYERGWGSKLDDWMVCLTVEDVEDFKEEFNSYNTEKTAPDWYMIAEGEPEPIDLNDAQYAILKSEGRVWLSTIKNK